MDPLTPIRKGLTRAKTMSMSQSMKGTYEFARDSAAESKEVLVYGRVFAGSIEADLMLTREVSLDTIRRRGLIDVGSIWPQRWLSSSFDS